MSTLRHNQSLWQQRLVRLFPFLAWLPELFSWGTLRADVLAGMTVAMLLIPQSMAYAHLAGLPVYMGLYAAFIPPIIGALFGSSRMLSTGPVPVTSLLTVAAMQLIAPPGSIDYIHYVLLLTCMAGLIQLLLGILGFGIVVNFISYPVILGFINGVAILIASMQLGNLLGIYAAPAPRYLQTVWQVLTDAVDAIHWPSVTMATIAFVIIIGGRRLYPRLPHTLIAVIVTTFLAWATDYEKLETVQVKQIVNAPVQEILANYRLYPLQSAQAIKEASDTKKALRETIKKQGSNSEETETAMSNAALAKVEMERILARHNFETSELNRLTFRRLLTQDKKIVFFVDDQMSPIGKVDRHAWHIATLPESDELTLRAGGEVIGSIPKGLPKLSPMSFNWDTLTDLFMPALLIALIGFAEAITIAKRMATEHRQQLDVSQEMIGQGLAKSIGSFFQSMPVSGGFSRSALNAYAGAKTGFSSVIAGLVVMVVLLWLTPLFYYLPYATLAAVIMVSVLGLLDFKKMWGTWRINRNEGLVTVITFTLTLVLAPRLTNALALGTLLSLGVYLYETMRPRFTELTRNEEGELVEIDKPELRKMCQLVSLVRFNGSLYFGSASYFEEKILQLIAQKRKLRWIVLDCVSINKLDASGLDALRSVCAQLEEAGIAFWFARARPPVLSVIKSGGLYAKLGDGHFYKNNEAALQALAYLLGEKHMSTCPLAKK